jgi:acyl-CoA synthetase (NDP forming)
MSGGVALRLTDVAAVRRARPDGRPLGDAMGGAIVQRMAAPGVETIVGVTQDPSFGPLVLFGSGASLRSCSRTVRCDSCR